MYFLHKLLPFVSIVSSVVSSGVSITYSAANDKECTVTALGKKLDDVPNILKAFSECNNGGHVIFPDDQEYWIAKRVTVVLNDVKVKWKGKWTMSDDLEYWRKNSYPVAFQNHRAGIIFSGRNFELNGHGIGGIHGNGEAWYNAEQAKTHEGRPMPFVLWNASNVLVKGFNVWQPPLWAVNIMNGTNMRFQNLYVNATASKSKWGKNWVQNTDGFDTMDANNITLSGFVYQGGDDCIAIKPRSYNIAVSNVTCRGGNGIAIGSLGQYQEDSSVENVTITDVKIVRYNEDMHNSAYIKTWMGGLVPQNSYESGGQPRGGGWGVVRNVVFRNFVLEGADSGPSITQDNGNDGSYSGTSKMEISKIVFENFSGWLQGRKTTGSINCSKAKPCHDIEFRNVRIRTSKDEEQFGKGSCRNVPPGAVKGLAGCSS